MGGGGRDKDERVDADKLRRRHREKLRSCHVPHPGLWQTVSEALGLICQNASAARLQRNKWHPSGEGARKPRAPKNANLYARVGGAKAGGGEKNVQDAGNQFIQPVEER